MYRCISSAHECTWDYAKAQALNCENFAYIMNIVDEPWKFSPSIVLSYTVSKYHGASYKVLWIVKNLLQVEIFLDKCSRMKVISNKAAREFDDKYFQGSGNILKILEIFILEK